MDALHYTVNAESWQQRSYGPQGLKCLPFDLLQKSLLTPDINKQLIEKNVGTFWVELASYCP